VREPARVASVSNHPDPERLIVTSADSGSAGGGTSPATRRTSLFTSSIAGHSAGAFHEIAIGSSSGAVGAVGTTTGPGRFGAPGAGAIVLPEGASPALTTTRAIKAGSRPISWAAAYPNNKGPRRRARARPRRIFGATVRSIFGRPSGRFSDDRQVGSGTGVTPVPWPQQSQAHGGQLCPGTHAGHAQPHPPPPGTGFIWTHAPVGHGVVTQTIPSSIHRHEVAVSAAQPLASPWCAQGSVGASAAGPTVGGAPLLTPTLPVPQAQSHGGQVVPAAQLGHAHVHVPEPLPVFAPGHDPPLLQSQLHGGHVSPGAQVGQVQVQVGTPLPPPATPDTGFEQSHWTAGQSAFAGHAIGWTQVQPPPDASRAWQ